jgi:hypothetical protein
VGTKGCSDRHFEIVNCHNLTIPGKESKFLEIVFTNDFTLKKIARKVFLFTKFNVLELEIQVTFD